MGSRLPLLLLAVLSACADGGKEDRPQSEVRFTNTNHLFAFRTLRGFGAFPVQPSVVFTDRGTLSFFDDSTYTFTEGNSTTSPEEYALADDGKLSMFRRGGGNEPATVLFGGYSRVGANDLLGPGDTPDWFYTDRVSTPGSPSIGLFYGTKKIDAAIDLRSDWHVMSLHTVFGATLQAPDNVGRAMHGNVTVTGASAAANLDLSGTGFQSDSSLAPAAGLVLAGQIQFLLDGATGDGRCNLTMQYDGDSRVMRAATNGDTMFVLDEDETDGEAGVAFLVREFDDATVATQADPTAIAGTYYVGGQTLFINPSNMGSDTFIGTVTLSSNGGFELDAVGNQGVDFGYVGTWTAQPNGKLTITVNGNGGETWHGAIDRSYNTLVLVDDYVETRANNLPELNLLVGIRKKTP